MCFYEYKKVSSFGISLIPGLGDAKDLQEAIGGMDLITGKKLSALERVLAGACVIVPVVSGSMVRIAGKNANIAEKMSLSSEKQLFRKGAKAGITMCEDAKKEMEQLIREIRNILEEDVDIKRLFAQSQGVGSQVEFAGVGKVSVGEVEKLVGKDARWSIGKSGSNFKGRLYNGTRNPNVDFVNDKGKSTLNKHAGKHGYTSPEEYLKDARNFLEKKTTSTIQSFVSNGGTYFRYDTTTNEFGIINEYGGISTYFKPENGMAYWLEQIENMHQNKF